MQLSLSSSGQADGDHLPMQYVVPALTPVALDLFCHRGSSASVSSTGSLKSAEAELEAQREVMLGLLIKNLHLPQVVATFVKILRHYKGDGTVTTDRYAPTILITFSCLGVQLYTVSYKGY